LKVLQVNHSDINGGAARAAYRIHHALRDTGVDSTMWVNQASAGDWTVEGPPSKLGKTVALIRPQVAGLLTKTLRTENLIIHSPAIFPSLWVKRINQSDADLVHLHWVAGEMLSIADIGRIEKPIVWTLHDMWAFCGAEHYTEDFRWREGYRSDNRSAYESGFDLNRWTWERKRKHWERPLHIVTPSRWLGDCVRASALMCEWQMDVISYPIDIERWRPIEQNLARDLFGLPRDVPLLLFGAMGGGHDPRKGFDLLARALENLRGSIPGLELVVFGQLAPLNPPDLGFPVHYTGHVHDDLSLRVLYSAADVFALPSRQDNLPLTCIEALCCGAPVVAFNASGPPTMIMHQQTGFLAKAFDAEDFAEGILWVFRHSDKAKLRKSARNYAEQSFNSTEVARQYMDIYYKILSK